MRHLLDILSDELKRAFRECGYDDAKVSVTVSNRPDLCEYQCNGAMALAKEAHKAPFVIAEEVASKLTGSEYFSKTECVKPGFINLNISDGYLASYIAEQAEAEKYGLEPGKSESVVVDYGGPNVAKPLHIGHLRAAIIGEAVKRLSKYTGNKTLGDIHMGDWGLQIGLIIAEMQERGMDRMPTLEELSEIYPAASARSKEDEAYKEKAMDITYKLQHGDEEYLRIWRHIMDISVADLKANYDKLNVSFEIWKGESDADPYIAPMVERMKKEGYAYSSQGALVVDVSEESDAKEIPPCMILKSDGAALYTTTDLATLVQREEDYKPDSVIYVVDKRQDMHFLQVFRAAKKCGIVPEETRLEFLGFGTMNGKDGKPFKTRSGGVMKLQELIDDVYQRCYERMKENGAEMTEEELTDTAAKIGLAAIKYGDLSNEARKDYIFDIDKFTSFEGNTGPYVLYTIVRIKSILRKYKESGGRQEGLRILTPANAAEKAMMMSLTGFAPMIEGAWRDLAPHRICAYIYQVANDFNKFYHETKIITEEDRQKQESWIALLTLTKGILESCIDILGFEAPEKM
ncbi:MAG TPA: arginine--tRNA ligase [Lachnospiraceae bacterium]|nr:arginine--tRNA ligase [Lachnospiraceae bacterium]